MHATPERGEVEDEWREVRVVVAVEAASRTFTRRRVALEVFNQREQPLCLDLVAGRAHHEHARAVAAADVDVVAFEAQIELRIRIRIVSVNAIFGDE